MLQIYWFLQLAAVLKKHQVVRHSTVPAGDLGLQCFSAGTWNRRNNCKNNGSMSFSSFVAFGRWNVVFVLFLDLKTAAKSRLRKLQKFPMQVQ